jgi:hypothetical protein
MGATKTLNVYLPASLYREIEREARKTGKTKGGVVRDKLAAQTMPATGSAIADLFGVANDLPADLSTKKDAEFREYGQGRFR